MDVNAYLTRIGAGPPEAPSPAALKALHQRHLYSVPWENLDIYRGVRLSLDESEMIDKVVRQRRGGSCTELNTAFAWLLRNLGYRVTILGGDLAVGPDSYGQPNHHMLLLVDFGPDQPQYIADVGYGAGCLHPLPFVPDALVPDRSWRYRLVAAGEYWVVQRASKDSDTFASLYRFTTAPRSIADFAELVEWAETAPDSMWRKINCFLATPEGIVHLFGNRLSITVHGQTTDTWVRGEADLRRVLRKHFNLTLPPAAS